MKLQLKNFVCGVKALVSVVSALASLAIVHAANAAPAQSPLFLQAPVRPIMMLNMSKEHQLFFKLYDDYSDITRLDGGAPDDVPDLTYNNNFDYYGYFDSNKCYTYNTTSGLFSPSQFRTDKYCNAGTATSEWSGNFLNWSTMTRMDAVRKILYGGKRSTDTATATVLERAFLPNDAHSFAKYYAGADLPRLTPFASNGADADVMQRGITICNTTEPESRATLSQNATGANDLPLIRVARGNYSLWASNERWQCRWGQGNNDNNAAISEINAHSGAPGTGVGLGNINYVARVAVCTSDALIDVTNNERCQKYGTSSKPIGLLQTYGENNSIHFGLMTGSYTSNKSGGVLRKKVGSITDEINSNGTFKVPDSKFSIIKTIDLLRIYGYRFDDGIYHSATGSDGCSWARSEFDNGTCTNWGNPQAEIYLESLRYLAGLESPDFNVSDADKISAPNLEDKDAPFTLNQVAAWDDPVDTGESGNYCAPLNVLQFNASTTSYDTDDLDGAEDLGFSELDSTVDAIGVSEGVTGGTNNKYFVGSNGGTSDADKNQICDAKTVTALSAVSGICPESPRLEGGYKIAGLAYLARKDGVAVGREKVKTFGVALAPAVPKVTITVPGTSGNTKKTVTILPACRNLLTTPDANCAIVDFKLVKQETDASGNITGKLYVNWEDSEQGGDFDQDMWGVISYSVTSTNVTVQTQVVAQSTGDPMGFGFVISGTEQDGFHVYSGANNFTFEPQYTGVASCSATGTNRCTCRTGGTGTAGACDVAYNSALQSHTFTIGNSTAKSLQPPLYYAAKWGGYKNNVNPTTGAEIELTTAEIAAQTAPETYFYATDPRKLEASLKAAFADIAAAVGSAATVAANSTRLTGETFVYQATFNSSDWSGQLLAYPLKPNGTIDTNAPAAWQTDSTLTRSSTRKIYTYDGDTARSLVKLDSNAWTSSLPSLKAALRLSGEPDDTVALKRFNWLLGSSVDENVAGGMRIRKKLLGDVVNSDPAFAGAASQRYNLLPDEYGSASYAAYVAAKKTKTAALFVGANDGMLHAFNASTGAELFAYIPRGAYSKLAEVSKPGYVHQYLVDGPMYVGDVYFDSDNDGVGGEWRTIVAGTLGYGGRGAYALDVTDALSAGGGEPEVIFDVSAEDSSVPYRNDLGYSAGKILIVPTADGQWSAIFGNGTDSNNGIAKLIAIDVEDPTNYAAIDTEVASNGLSGAALLPGGTGVITHAYAGDLKGNMWKFDLTNDDMDRWSVAYNGKPVIKVIDSDGVEQPITATPTLGLNALKKVGTGANAKSSVMIYFGTGKYYESTDGTLKTIQSIYGIADTEAISLTKSNRTTKLHEKTIASESATSRVIADDSTPASEVPEVDWDDQDGWFLDLKAPSKSATGERVLSKPLLLFDRIILSTFIPSSNQCDYGGDGWLMELTGVGDKFIGHSILGTKGNHILDNAIIGDLIPIIAGEKVHIIGSGLGDGGEKPPLITIDGDAGKGTRGRMSWRQIK